MSDQSYNTCYTLGHGEATWDQFADLLDRYGIQLVVDVRALPFTLGPEGFRLAPWFDRDQLEARLQRRGISYRWMGRELGPLMRDGRLDGVAREQDPEYRQGVEELMELIHNYVVLILDRPPRWEGSHRHLVIAQTLLRHDIEVVHLSFDAPPVPAQIDLFHAI